MPDQQVSSRAALQALIDSDTRLQAALANLRRGDRSPATLDAIRTGLAVLPATHQLDLESGQVVALDARGRAPIPPPRAVLGGTPGFSSLAGRPRGTVFPSETIPSRRIPGSDDPSILPQPIRSQGVSEGFGVPGFGPFLPATPSVGGMMPSIDLRRGGGSGGGSVGGDILRGLMSPAGIASLVGVIAGLKDGSGLDESTEELQRIQRITEAQMRRADPLQQIAVQMAYGRAPTRYRQGVNLTPVPLPEY